MNDPLTHRIRIERALRHLDVPPDYARLILDQNDLAVACAYERGRQDGRVIGRRDGWDACGAKIAAALDQHHLISP